MGIPSLWPRMERIDVTLNERKMLSKHLYTRIVKRKSNHEKNRQVPARVWVMYLQRCYLVLFIDMTQCITHDGDDDHNIINNMLIYFYRLVKS